MSRGQRQHPRFDATLRVEFGDAREFLSAYTRSISKGGLFIESDDPLPEGTMVRLHLKLPTSGEVLEVSAVVAYVIEEHTETEVRQPPGMGVEFRGLDAGTQAALDDYIRFLQNKSRGRILLVDADAEYAGMVQEFLREHDFSVVCVNNAQAALNTLHHGSFDIVVVDAQLPRMDGLELTDAVRGLPHGNDLPVLLLTSSPLDDQQRTVAERLSVFGIFLKPVLLDELLINVDDAQALRERESAISAEGVVPDLPANEAKLDPGLEATLARQRREAQIAHKYLTELGVRARFNRERTEVLGELLIGFENLTQPFSGERIPRLGIRSVGHDRFRVYAPECLTLLPDVAFLDLNSQQDLERCVGDAIRNREEECRNQQEWLQGLGIACRLDGSDFVCRGVVVVEDLPIVFHVAGPTELIVDRVGHRPVGGSLSVEERTVDVSGIESRLEIEMNVEPVVRLAEELEASQERDE